MRLWIALLTFSTVVLADQLEAGRGLFYKAVEDAVALPLARAEFSQFAGNATAEMYLATLESLEAKHSLWPMRKYNLANSAIKKMAQIVQVNPDNYEIRFLYGSTLFYLPFFFDQSENAKREIRYLSDNLSFQVGVLTPQLISNVADFLIKTEMLPDEEVLLLKAFQKGHGH
jgi:hypothetical protein